MALNGEIYQKNTIKGVNIRLFLELLQSVLLYIIKIMLLTFLI